MKTYHIFTNNQDEWTDTLEEAVAVFNEFMQDNTNGRIYEEEVEGDEVVKEDCILSVGAFPQ